MRKRFEHTAGPWECNRSYESLGCNHGLLVWDRIGRCVADLTSDNGSLRKPERRSNADRIVSCVNGCDAAGIVEPDGLAHLLAVAAETVKQLRCMDETGHSHMLDKALRAVRGDV